ncbi:hypothetical protein ACLOJK_039304 [Asimina triloba]
MVDAVVSVLVDKLVILLVSEGRQLLEFNDQFEETKNELCYIQSYLKDADRVKRKDRSEILKTVMFDLRALVYDAQEVVEDCQRLQQRSYQGCKPNFVSRFSPANLKRRKQLGRQLRRVNGKIMKLKERMMSYMGAAPSLSHKEEDGGNWPLTYPALFDEAEMVGIEDDSAKIAGWILKADGPLMVIGIVGMGGLGKTALAQKIYNTASVKNTFQHSIFVTVSQSFSLDELLKKILRKVDVEEESLRGMEIDELLKKLRSMLEKRYLIILDDVWGTDERQWWNSLKSALPKVLGSCVIVTTRIESVAKSMGATEAHIHHPQVLTVEESWSLFSKVAFAANEGRCTSHVLEGFGKEIVAKCGGLPLAIKVVGGMMFGKGDSIHEWQRIAEHLKEELATSKKDELVLSCLELSYEELPVFLKPCFLCFAMYPEDYEITDFEMICRWVGEGFISGRDGKTAIEAGEECFAELINRCLILGKKRDPFDSCFESCKLHDMVRDMIIKVAKEESSVNLGISSWPESNVLSRRVWILRDGTVEDNGNSSKKRMLVDAERNGIHSSAKRNSMIFGFRELSLTFPLANGELGGRSSVRHLVYLRLDGIRNLQHIPDSIGNLYNLQILCLIACPDLETLPESIAALEKLVVLYIHSCNLFMPEGIREVSNLEHLSWFRPRNMAYEHRGCRISQLGNLTRLRELWVEIKGTQQIEEQELEVLSMLENLQVLHLDFVFDYIDPGLANRLDHQLPSPLKRLRELRLIKYPGERTPAWLNPATLPNLQFLEINRGKMWQMGPHFWDCSADDGGWKIEVLVLDHVHDLQEEWARMARVLPCLRLLKIRRCLRLKSFKFNVSADGEWRTWRKEEEVEEEKEEGEATATDV